MRVEWTPWALQDLYDIEDYIAKDSYNRAVNFVNELIALGDSLSGDTTYEQGTPAPWIEDTSIRELYYEGYTIVYEICDTTIRIHEVYNQKRIHLRYGKRRYS